MYTVKKSHDKVMADEDVLGRGLVHLHGNVNTPAGGRKKHVLAHARFMPKPEHLCVQRERLACAQSRVGVAGKGKNAHFRLLLSVTGICVLKELRAWGMEPHAGARTRHQGGSA